MLAKPLQKDILKLFPAEQTFAVESYHSVINYFVPKLHVFSYHGMHGRLLLAALHYNENRHRSQATTRDGTLRYAIKFPKFKKGGYCVRKVKCESTYVYVQWLMNAVADVCCDSSTVHDNISVALPPLSAACNRPNKQSAVAAHQSRYSR